MCMRPLAETPKGLRHTLAVIKLMGLRPWLYYSLRLDEAVAWCQRVIYCHHNARVLSDMEYRLSCVLTTCTRTMSKPYYDVDDMTTAIQEYIMEAEQDAILEFLVDLEKEPDPAEKVDRYSVVDLCEWAGVRYEDILERRAQREAIRSIV